MNVQPRAAGYLLRHAARRQWPRSIMYIPRSFREPERDVAFDLIDEYGFATLVSWGAGEPMVSHLPLLLDRSVPGGERLLGHVARANEHFRRFDGKEPALAIFHGPHAYISPSWYTTHPAVPTWNYAVVHVHGTPLVVDETATWEIVRGLTEKYEARRPKPWSLELPPDYVEKNLRAIVGFTMPIGRVETKLKLSQNKPDDDRLGALGGLESERHAGSLELASFMRGYFERKRGA